MTVPRPRVNQIDAASRVLGTASFPATGAGCGQLWRWLRGLGDVERVGVERASSYGTGLSRLLAVEVLRRAHRGRRGHNNDATEGVTAARAVLSGETTGCPKSADGPMEAIRVLCATRRSRVKARTGSVNLLKGLLLTAGEQVAGPRS